MIHYLREELLIHLGSSAKKVMDKKGHSLKKNMPRNVSKKNALRVARLRKKNDEEQEKIQQLKNILKENSELKKKVRNLQEEISTSAQETIHKEIIKETHHARLQNIISLQREIMRQQAQAKKFLKTKKISKNEYDELNEKLEKKQNILRKKKQKILSS